MVSKNNNALRYSNLISNKNDGSMTFLGWLIFRRIYLPLDIPPPYIPCSAPAFLYLVFPKDIGTYLCLYICMICRFMVMKKRTKK